MMGEEVVADKIQGRFEEEEPATLSELAEKRGGMVMEFISDGEKPFEYDESENSLKTDIETSSVKEKTFGCGLCIEKLRVASSMKEHIETIQKEQKCDLCSQMFSNPLALQDTRFLNLMYTMHYNGEKRPFKCDKCWWSFKNPSGLREHIKAVHNSEKFKCDYCEKDFKYAKSLKQHIEVHCDPKRVKCNYCCIDLPSTSKLANRVVKRHRGEHKPEKCDHCGRSFFKPGVLQRHIKTIHSGDKPEWQSNEKLFKCDKCDKDFKTERSVRRHKRTVHNKSCPKPAVSTQGIQTTHDDEKPERHTTEKLFDCCYCNKNFTAARSVRRHIRAVHKESRSSPENKKSEKKSLECLRCGECFWILSKLKLHEQIVHRGYPFAFRGCGNGFLKQDDVTHHLNERKELSRYYRCKNCGLLLFRSLAQKRLFERVHNNGIHIEKEQCCKYNNMLFNVENSKDDKQVQCIKTQKYKLVPDPLRPCIVNAVPCQEYETVEEEYEIIPLDLATFAEMESLISRQLPCGQENLAT